ncbi:MAG: hypothetical protein AAGD96_29670 [Chloroflexota bacterium]
MTKQNVRLTAINLALMAFLLTTLVSIGWTQVGAQEDGETPAPTKEELHDCEIFFEDFEDGGWIEVEGDMLDLAAIIGIDEETLWQSLDEGKSLAEIAAANGVDPQVLIDAMVAEEEEFIKMLLDAGEISEEEAAEWRAKSAEYMAFEVNNSFTDPFAVAWKTIGIDEDTFWTELENGKTAAEIAQENGVDPQTVIDAVLKSEYDMLQKEIDAGLITEDEAAEIKAEISTYVEESVNQPIDFFFMDEEIEMMDGVEVFELELGGSDDDTNEDTGE